MVLLAPTPALQFSVETFPHLDPGLLISNFSPTGQSVYVNDEWKETVGTNWSRLAREDRERAVEYLSEAASGSLVTNQFFMVQTAAEDDPLPVLLNFLPVHIPTDSNKEVIGAIVVTGEVLREPATWTQSQTQRNRLETLGRMTMGIAHDFNNLLSGILGYTELLINYARDETDDDALVDHLRTVEQAALDGAALIRKIQQYIRQEKQTHFAPLDIPTLIQDCITLTRPYWYNEPRRQGIAIEVDQQFQDVPPVMGSATELREVFLNLILNAVQAMPDGGKLSIRTEPTDVGVSVSVIDTGIGMSEAVRQRIFEPLYTTKGERGTGMGLAVSYGIIQEHEGSINVTSEVGEGTLFRILFPPAENAREEHEADAKPEAGRNARVLVVDDEEMVRNILQKLLSIKGHHVTAVSSGPEALEVLERQEFDVIFTDLGMPDMNGRQLARAVRNKFRHVPIVLLSGDTNLGEPGEDINVVLAKPFKIDKLDSTIQHLLEADER